MPLAHGTRLGPYEILSPIGAGGMGEVYKALDTRLGRPVAIKTLHSPHMERFGREARAIAALNHPHICALYDVGPDYLVMEYVEGVPLQGPLPPAKALRYATQIAQALEAAHAKGITHRDLKPGNILISASGVKLLDFGLAKLTDPADPDATQTLAGTVMGTAAYMSPEQAQGLPTDARSDIFSFGLVLYELLSGRRAFAAETALATMAAIVRDEPKPLDAPPALQSIVARCLRKSPADRFPSAADLRAALEQAAAVARPEEKQPSIAVLPFANMSRDAGDEYFSDGLAEEIINALTQVSGLKVIARTSAFAFKGKNEDIRKIAETLGVSTVLEGSVRRAGNRLRITAQLVHAADGMRFWSQRYDREMTDVFAIQDEISAAIADQLKVHLTGRKRQNTNLAAYEALLEGRHNLYKTTPAGLAKALECYARAISIDPGYALPYAGIAECHQLLAALGLADPRASLAKTKASAAQALELDPSLPEAHAQLGVVNALLEYNWTLAERHFHRARELNPALRHVRMPYMAWYLRPLGRLEEAIVELDGVLEQDPLAVIAHSVKGQSLLYLRRYDAAAACILRGLEIEPHHAFSMFVLTQVLARQHRIEEALATAEQALQAYGRFSITLGSLAEAYAAAGRKQDTHRVLDELQERGRETYVPAGLIARIHSTLGDADTAFAWADKAVEQRDPQILLIKIDPAFDSLRSDQRYPALLNKMNLA